MDLRTMRYRFSIGTGLKLLLATTGPLQNFLDRPGTTHEFCNRQALTILRKDGFSHCARFFDTYIKELNAGVFWADEGWQNAGHYLEPVTGRGLWHFPNAISEFRRHLGQALNQARRGNSARAAFFVGAAAHLVQDLCVPHHARAQLFSGHRQYEAWVQNNHAKYAVDNGGIYYEDHPAHSLLLKNATVTAEFLNWVKEDCANLSYHKATAILLPRAQRTTAGLFLQFFVAAGEALRAA